MKKMLVLLFIFALCAISLSASEKETALNNDTVKSAENINFNFNIAARTGSLNSFITGAEGYASAKTSGAGADFYTFLKKNQQLFFWLAIGLTIGAAVFLSMGIAGSAMAGWYWSRYIYNPAGALDYTYDDYIRDRNVYYAGIALAAVGWTFFALTLIGAVTCWVFYGISVDHEKKSGGGSSKQPAKKRRMMFEIAPTRYSLGIQF